MAFCLKTIDYKKSRLAKSDSREAPPLAKRKTVFLCVRKSKRMITARREKERGAAKHQNINKTKVEKTFTKRIMPAKN